MRTIAIVNQKGGCGKTTTAINLAGILARDGLRVLLVDMDPQSHCAAGMAIPEQRIDLDIGDVMLGPVDEPIDRQRLLWRVSRNLDLAPSRMKLAGLEAARGGLADLADRERRLAGVLSRLADGYDVCLIDCSPSIGLLAYNALAAAEDVLVPVETSYFALQGAAKQVNTVRAIAKRLGISPAVWLVATMHEESSALACDVVQELQRRFARKVVPVVIRRDQRLREAASFGQPIVEYAPASTGASDYSRLASWLREVTDLGAGGRVPMVEVAPPPRVEAAIGRKLGYGSEGTSEAPAAARPAPGERAAELTRLAQQAGLDRASGSTEAAREPGALRAIFGVRHTARGLLFVQPDSLGREVSIAGSFNGWSESSHRMRRNGELGVLELCVPVEPGRVTYRLVVDGRSMIDPFNPSTELGSSGELHSVVEASTKAPRYLRADAAQSG